MSCSAGGWSMVSELCMAVDEKLGRRSYSHGGAGTCSSSSAPPLIATLTSSKLLDRQENHG